MKKQQKEVEKNKRKAETAARLVSLLEYCFSVNTHIMLTNYVEFLNARQETSVCNKKNS